MIRQPLYSAFGRTRPDLNRVADGIASSLRHFSVAQRLRDDKDSNNGNDRPRPTGRQRAAAAFDDLMSMTESANNQITPAAATSSETTPAGPGTQAPNVVNGGAGGFKGFTKFDSGDDRRPNPPGPSGVTVIRGGFRGRGGFAGRGGGGDGRGRGAGGFPRGGRGRGRGRGGRSSDDRPMRAMGPGRVGRGRRRGRDEEGGGGGRGGRTRQRGDQKDNAADTYTHADNPTVRALLEEGEIGATRSFDPSISLDSLLGHGPAVATSNTQFAAGETVVRQARVLGGGQAYHETHLLHPDDARALYRQGSGVFAPTREAKEWYGAAIKTEMPAAPPAETKTAVLEAALLGKYEGPKFADQRDTLAVVRSYVKRDGTWNAGAERGVEEKVRGLLSGGRDGQKARGGARTKA